MNSKHVRFISYLITLILFYNFDIFLEYSKHFIEQLIGNDQGARLYAGQFATLMIYFLPTMLCLIPIVFVGMLIEESKFFKKWGEE